jgi:uncharacterized membrane protein
MSDVKIEDTITDTIEIFKAQWITLILATLVVFVGSLFIVTIPPLVFGLYILCLKLARGEEAEVQDVFDGFSYFLRSWGVLLVSGILIGIGFAFLIIPGIALIILFTYAIPLAIVKDLKAIDSLKASFELAKENLQFTVILALIVYAIGAVGSMIKIGVILTTPFTAVAISIAVLGLTREK